MGWHRWGTIFLRFQSLTRPSDPGHSLCIRDASKSRKWPSIRCSTRVCIHAEVKVIGNVLTYTLLTVLATTCIVVQL